MTDRVILKSPHDPVAAALKLQAAVSAPQSVRDRRATSFGVGESRVTGFGTEDTITLFHQHRNVRNDFAIRFEGTMHPEVGGTRIDGTFGAARRTRLFLRIWFSFLGLFVLIAIPIVVVADLPWFFGAIFLGVPLVMALFGWALQHFCASGAQRDRAAMLAFLADAIDARVVGEGAQGA